MKFWVVVFCENFLMAAWNCYDANDYTNREFSTCS